LGPASGFLGSRGQSSVTALKTKNNVDPRFVLACYQALISAAPIMIQVLEMLDPVMEAESEKLTKILEDLRSVKESTPAIEKAKERAVELLAFWQKSRVIKITQPVIEESVFESVSDQDIDLYAGMRGPN
jgi:hypothetical protein